MKIKDFEMTPRIPKSTGMEVIEVFDDFDYKNKLENAYGDNGAKLSGTDEKIRKLMAKAIDKGEWKPEYYPKPATMVATAMTGKYRQITGFTTRSAYILAGKDTMFIYLVKFFEAKDEDGVMQPSNYWEQVWRTKENVNGEFDYIKTPEDKENIKYGAKNALEKGNYTKGDNDTYSKKDITTVLKQLDVANPSDNWINEVRAYLGSAGVMTNAEDFDVSDNKKLEDSLIIITKTFGSIKDPKMDSQVVDSIEQGIVNNENAIRDKLEKKEPYNISVVGKTLNADIEKSEKIRDSKKQIFLDIFEARYKRYKIIDKLIDDGFSLRDALESLWRGQKPDEEEGELYDN